MTLYVNHLKKAKNLSSQGTCTCAKKLEIDTPLQTKRSKHSSLNDEHLIPLHAS